MYGDFFKVVSYQKYLFYSAAHLSPLIHRISIVHWLLLTIEADPTDIFHFQSCRALYEGVLHQ